MHVEFKSSAWLILAITAFACSRMVFALFNDPEGPNLLVVTGLAFVFYLMSLAVHRSNLYPTLTGFKRIAVAIFIQMVVATCFYVGLR